MDHQSKQKTAITLPNTRDNSNTKQQLTKMGAIFFPTKAVGVAISSLAKK
jgi:hypothetical protein